MKFKTLFTIRIVYKSGYTHDFEVYEFNIKNGNWTWKTADADNTPVLLGVDDIAAVWQLSSRKKFSVRG